MAENDNDMDDDEIESSGIFRWLQIAVVLFALGGFFGLAWYAYKSGEAVDEKDVELVKSDKTPVKEAPANPGGMQIPNQDKTVYNLISGGKAEKPVVERIMPATEEPIPHDGESSTWMHDKLKNKTPVATDAMAVKDKPVLNVPPVQEASADEPKNIEQFNPDKGRAAEDTPKLPAPPTPAATAEVKKEAAPKPAAALEEKKTTPLKESQQETTRKEVSKPEPATPTTGLPKTRIQLGALKSEEEAEKIWDKIAKQFSDELAGKQHYIVKVTVNGKGYYRLQAAPFNSPKEAEELCVTLVSAGQACILAKGK